MTCSLTLFTKQISIGGVEMNAVRISYTGELGWELYMDKSGMRQVYQELMEKGKAAKDQL